MTNDATPQSWRLQKAERFLLAAERAFEAEDWETVVSRTYYAAYHAIVGVLEAKTDVRIPRRHAQLHGLLHSPLAGGVVQREDVRRFVRLFVMREAADYRDDRLDAARAQAALAGARDLCEKMARRVIDG